MKDTTQKTVLLMLVILGTLQFLSWIVEKYDRQIKWMQFNQTNDVDQKKFLLRALLVNPEESEFSSLIEVSNLHTNLAPEILCFFKKNNLLNEYIASTLLLEKNDFSGSVIGVYGSQSRLLNKDITFSLVDDAIRKIPEYHYFISYELLGINGGDPTEEELLKYFKSSKDDRKKLLALSLLIRGRSRLLTASQKDMDKFLIRKSKLISNVLRKKVKSKIRVWSGP